MQHNLTSSKDYFLLLLVLLKVRLVPDSSLEFVPLFDFFSFIVLFGFYINLQIFRRRALSPSSDLNYFFISSIFTSGHKIVRGGSTLIAP